MVDNPNNSNKDGGKPIPVSTPMAIPMPAPAGMSAKPSAPVTAGPTLGGSGGGMPIKPSGPAAPAGAPTPISIPAPMQKPSVAQGIAQSTAQPPQSPPQASGKDFQALMKEMQTINQARTTPVSGGVINLGAPAATTPAPAPAMSAPAQQLPQQSSSGGGDDGYYQDDYYAPPPMSPIMKLFFAVQTLLSIIMVVLLIMMFNMFSSLKSQAVTADNMKAVLQSFVDGIANQNKALLDSFSVKMDEVGKGLTTLNENNTKNQESLDAITQKIDKAISRPPVIINQPKPAPVKKAKPVAPAPVKQQQNNNLPPLPGIDDLNNLPSLPDLPTEPQSKNNNLLNQSTQNANYQPNNQLQDNYKLPPLPNPTPNLFPNN